jgi:hypothetical protein
LGPLEVVSMFSFTMDSSGLEGDGVFLSFSPGRLIIIDFSQLSSISVLVSTFAKIFKR